MMPSRARRCVGTAVALALVIAGCTTVPKEEEQPVAAPTPQPTPTAEPSIAVSPPPAPKLEEEVIEAPPPPRAPTIVYKPSDVDILVNEFQRLRKLPGSDIAREQEAARQALLQSRSDTARVRYAMTLALPGTVPGDDARALETLEPVVRNGSSALNGLAVLLASYIQEQRRLGAQVQALQQKLDALRSLERSLSERRK